VPTSDASVRKPGTRLRQRFATGVYVQANLIGRCHDTWLSGSALDEGRSYPHAQVSDATIAKERDEEHQSMRALLEHIRVTREALRAKYGEFDVDAEIQAAREERLKHLDGLWP
jgi:hypothetical protein